VWGDYIHDSLEEAQYVPHDLDRIEPSTGHDVQALWDEDQP
jgi:hypothetical protein